MRFFEVGGFFDGEKNYSHCHTVGVEDDRIVLIEKGWNSNRTLEVLNFSKNSYLMPGMIDSHVHLSWDPSDNPETLPNISKKDLINRIDKNIAIAYNSGILGLRDLGDTKNIIHEFLITRNDKYKPNIAYSGSPLTVKGGHCWYLGGSVKDKKDVNKLIINNINNGATWIKVMVTGGVKTKGTDPNALQFDLDTLNHIVKVSKDFKIPVVGHAHSVSGIKACIESGFDGIEHYMVWYNYSISTS